MKTWVLCIAVLLVLVPIPAASQQSELRFVQVSAENAYTCALRSDGSIWCWGGNAYQMGDVGIRRSVPTRVPGIENAVAISAGVAHVCAVRNGEVWCWGVNWDGQLGDGTTVDRFTPARTPINAAAPVIAVAAGNVHTCALLSSGEVWCWGKNGTGRLGVSPKSVPFSNTPIPVPGIDDAIAIAAGSDHTCAMRSDGTVWCWGLEERLGNGMTSDITEPTPVSGIDDAVAIAAGLYHTCAVRSNGEVWCWGVNLDGQLGDGTTQFRAEPTRALGVTDAIAIDAGSRHTCAVRSNGEVWCWGENGDGQLGDGIARFRAEPTQVSGITDAIAVAVGDKHTCAMRSDGTVWCWGSNEDGQLGDGGRERSERLPSLSDAVDVAAGTFHTCAAQRDGTVWCWGNNLFGQLGDGTGRPRSTPILVPGIADVVTIAAGSYHTCAVRSNGEVWCWGGNGSGQLGLGYDIDTAPTPTRVPGIDDVVAISAGLAHTCAARSDGTVWCWGWNGELQTAGHAPDDPLMPDPLVVWTPEPLPGVDNVISLAAGDEYTCGVRRNGTVVCWGHNGFGQLGNSAARDPSVPTQTAMLSGVVDLAAGENHTCAILLDRTVRCWGNNDFGQLGTGIAPVRRLSPAPVVDPETRSSAHAMTRIDPGVTDADTVRWQVTFTQPVSNVTASSFSLSTSGSLRNVRIVGVFGTHDTYIVIVDTGEGGGTLRLGMAEDNGARDWWGRSLTHEYLESEEYSIRPHLASEPTPTATPTTPPTATPTATPMPRNRILIPIVMR